MIICSLAWGWTCCDIEPHASFFLVLQTYTHTHTVAVRYACWTLTSQCGFLSWVSLTDSLTLSLANGRSSRSQAWFSLLRLCRRLVKLKATSWSRISGNYFGSLTLLWWNIQPNRLQPSVGNNGRVIECNHTFLGSKSEHLFQRLNWL